MQSNQDFAPQTSQNGYGNVERPRAILTQTRLSAPAEYGQQQQQQQQQQDQVLIRSNVGFILKVNCTSFLCSSLDIRRLHEQRIWSTKRTGIR